ncbi:MAG: hypothetical protein ACI8YC_000534, partial [Salibacteraceae bacterium]
MKIIGTVILMLVLVACGGVDAPPKSTWSKKQLEEKKVIV